MKVLVLNGSPAGKNSITLQTVLYLEKRFPSTDFEILHVGQRWKSFEKDFSAAKAALTGADALLFCYPVYTFLVPAQLHRFLELIKENGVDLRGKCATQLSTSKHFYDSTAHRFVQDFCADLGLRYVRGLSADMDDLTTEEGRKQAVDFWRFFRWSVENGVFEKPSAASAPFAPVLPSARGEKAPGSGGEAVIVTDLSSPRREALEAMIAAFCAETPLRTRVTDLSQFPFSGGCLGCFRCASSGKCVHKDGFDDYLRSDVQSADAIVYAFSVRDHSMGSRFKLFDDRQFCNGHRTVTMGKPVAYLVDGPLSAEENLRVLLHARAEVGGNFLAGIACDETDPDGGIAALAKTLSFALETGYRPPADFYGVGGRRIFRDLIYQMRGLMRADHRFYRENGFYDDLPTRRKGRTAAMYLVGAMMNSPSLNKKLGSRMSEGMVMPYKKALKLAETEEPLD